MTIALFLLGLLGVLAVVAIIHLLYLGMQWLKMKIKQRLAAKHAHKVVFGDTKAIVEEYLAEDINKRQGISMEDLEKMCEEAPYFTAEIDDKNNVSEYEVYKADDVEERLEQKIKARKGVIVFE